jgi:hypothetical protein
VSECFTILVTGFAAHIFWLNVFTKRELFTILALRMYLPTICRLVGVLKMAGAEAK